MISAAQIRMARAALQWTAQELADRARIGVSSINRIEGGSDARKATIAAIERVFEDASIQFLEDGVALENDRKVATEQIDFFYKYRMIEDAHIERTRNIFTENEIYFPRYDQFNDPFDCKFDCSFDATRSELKKFMRSSYKNVGSGMNRKDLDVAISRWIREVIKKPKVVERRVRSDLEEELSKVGICSLSRVQDSILMWSHYSNCHQGFCLKFVDDRNDKFIAGAQEVAYIDDYPILNLIRDGTQASFKKSFLQKAKFWQYEKEWRIMDHINGPGIRRFPSHILVGVIFGWKMSQEHEGLIRNWCEEGPSNVSFFRAQPSAKTYSLEIVEA